MFSFARYEGLGVKEIQQYLKAHHANVYEYLPEPEIELAKRSSSTVAQTLAIHCFGVFGSSSSGSGR